MWQLKLVNTHTGEQRPPTEEDFLVNGYLNVSRLLDEFARLRGMSTRARPGFMAWFKAFIQNIDNAMQELGA